MKGTVHITANNEYDPKKVNDSIGEHLSRYDKFSDIAGKKVLLKINLLSAITPERASTTHPVVVRSVVEELQKGGASVMIADSPGGLFNRTMLKRAYDVSGMTKVAEDTGAELNFDTGSHVEKFQAGQFLKSFNVCDYLRGADLIIALPKIKTHMFCGLTCASKIMFGVVPGTEKVKYHTRFPDTMDFSRMLFDLTELSGVDLFLVDGIIGMEGRGPSQGNPRDVGVLISGTDPYLIDLHVTRLTGLDPKKLPIMRSMEEQKRITFDQSVPLSGNGMDIRVDGPFEPARGGSIATQPPWFLRRIAVSLSTNKPKISRRRCVGCGVCRDNCAGGAIRIVHGKAKISYSKCIRCYCCHELCPHGAVYLTIRESGLMDLIGDISFRYFTRPR
ncbi:MAG: DUF362 domain-containing protein [Thermoplasmatota archaeon]